MTKDDKIDALETENRQLTTDLVDAKIYISDLQEKCVTRELSMRKANGRVGGLKRAAKKYRETINDLMTDDGAPIPFSVDGKKVEYVQ